MTQESIMNYTRRITQASKSELVVIMFDIILGDIESAKEHYQMLDLEEYSKDLKHAQKFIHELMGILDYSFSISYALMSLYIYVQKTLVEAEIGRRPEKLPQAETVLEKLRTGFVGVSNEDTSGPMMKNTQQVYSGVTYNNGMMSDTFVSATDYNRGFTA